MKNTEIQPVYHSEEYAKSLYWVSHPEESSKARTAEFVRSEEHRINMIFGFCVVLVLVFCTAVVLFAH